MGLYFLIMIQIPVSAGELFDKVTILRIKLLKIKDNVKLAHIEKELFELDYLIGDIAEGRRDLDALFTLLYQTNLDLWEVEDKLRILEKAGEFESNFIDLARQVYHLNDQRFELKNKINILTGSEIVEVKEYVKYDKGN